MIDRRPWLAIALALTLSAVATLGLAHVRIDMSFRPLFADAMGETEATEAAERRFGQASGAHVGAILEPAHGRADDADFLRRTESLSQALDSVAHVVEVTTPTRAPGFMRDAFVSADGRRVLVLARLDLPLSDLTRRRAVIRELEAVLAERAPPGARVRPVGVSVVEAGYARVVLLGLARSFVLTTLALLLVLGLLYRRPAPVLLVMAGVSLAIPATLGLATTLGYDLTMLNSLVPVLILIIGVADAVHMLDGYARVRAAGIGGRRAVRRMVADMRWPCLLTTVTTALGFLSLGVARIGAIRDFGVVVAIGVVVAFALNFMVMPALLTLLPDRLLPVARRERARGEPRAERAAAAASAGASGWIDALGALVNRRPVAITAAFAALLVASVAMIPRIDADQRFNEEVAPEHPLRANQALLEREFGGFLGPELVVRRRDGGSLLDGDGPRRLDALHTAIDSMPEVDRVTSIVDLLAIVPAPALPSLRDDPRLGATTRELVTVDGRHTQMLVRTADLGSKAAPAFVERLREAATRELGPDYQVDVVGQWWLAQLGVRNVVRDMTTSFALSCALVLPLVLLALRRWRLFLVSLAPNLLPMTAALAFMGAAGISLRVGTAMVLAIALGIAVDDSIHLLVRLRRAAARGLAPADAVTDALRHVGRPMLYTTLALVAGFLSMLSNDLIAIRDMGLVGAVTIASALAADLLLAPALYLLAAPKDSTSSPSQDYVAGRSRRADAIGYGEGARARTAAMTAARPEPRTESA